jgi:circadian clock protein KaiB
MMDDAESVSNAWHIRITLFVASDSVTSTLAIERLRRALTRHEPARFDLEIVDIADDPKRLLRESILVTPTLVATECGRRVVGDLSNTTRLEYFLQTLIKLRSEGR